MKNLANNQASSTIKLYSYWRSSASWRVRWALIHKKIPFEIVSVNLLKNEHLSQDYKLLNPLKSVPTIQLYDKTFHIESGALLEFIEESAPIPPLLPKDPRDRLVVRELSQLIISDVHPLQNLKILSSLYDSQEEKSKFASKWIRQGLEVYSELLHKNKCNGKFSFGDSLSMADLCLIPQLYNARRHGVDVSKEFHTLQLIEDECYKLESAKQSHPDQQPDAVKIS